MRKQAFGPIAKPTEAFTARVTDPATGEIREITLTASQLLALSSAPQSDIRLGLPPSPLFADLDDLAIIELGRRGRQRRLGPGSTIFSQDEVADSVYMVIQGRVRSTTKDSHGRNWAFFEMATATPGDLFGAEALIADVRPQSATAIGEVVVLQISADDFKELLRLHPQLAINLAMYSLDRMMRGNLRFAQFSGAFTVQKIAMVLLGRAQSEGVPDSVKGRVRIDTPIKHEELASMIGTTRESVVAAMKKLDPIVTRNGKIYSVDPEGLTRLIEQ